MRRRAWLWFALPTAILFTAFWVLPMVALALTGAADGGAAYLAVLTTPRYWRSLANTAGLSLAATVATLVLAVPVARFLAAHRHFRGRGLLMAMLTFPLAFPGVVVGFFIILLAGRQGVIGRLAEWMGGSPVAFAYGMLGLFLGYLYFSLPRAVGVITAAAEGMDPALTDAGRTLGAGAWRRFVDIELPALRPALTATGAMCFATGMGAFGTAFTLSTRVEVLPMTIYGELTNYANIPMAAALSVVLGLITWLVLYLAHGAGARGAAA